MKDVLCQQREYGEWTTLLDTRRAAALCAEVRKTLVPLPRTAASVTGGFRVADVYLERVGAETPLSTRHRIRRYDTEDLVWLESKRSDGERVRVERTPVPADLARVMLPTRAVVRDEPDGETITGARFLRQVALLDLRPRFVVSYEREGYHIPGTTTRFTVDRFVQVRPTSRWLPRGLEGGIELDSRFIVKLSFDDYPPALFRRLRREFHLTLTPFCMRDAAREKLVPTRQTGTG